MNGPIYITISCRVFGLFPDKPPSTRRQMIVAATDPKIQTLLRIQVGQTTCAVSLCWIPKTSASTCARGESRLSAGRSQKLSVPLWHTINTTVCCGYNGCLTTRSFKVCHPTLAIERPTAVPCDFSNATPPAALRDQTTGAKNWYAVTHSQVPHHQLLPSDMHNAPDPRRKKHSANFVQTLTKTFAQLSIGPRYF